MERETPGELVVLFFSESLVSVDLRVKKVFQQKLAKEREEKERCVYWKILGKKTQATLKKTKTPPQPQNK